MPFLDRWEGSAFFTGWMLIEVWYMFFFFGWWAAFFPPRKRLSWLAFSLAAIGAGLLFSHELQHHGIWDYELADGNVVTPPAGSTAIYAHFAFLCDSFVLHHGLRFDCWTLGFNGESHIQKKFAWESTLRYKVNL